MTSTLLFRTGLAGLMLALPLESSSAQVPEAECKSELCSLVASRHLSILRWPDFSDCTTRIGDFYIPVNYALAWTRDGRPIRQAREVVEVLKDAARKGLDPEDYDGSRWANRIAMLGEAGKTLPESDLARFDLALTVSTMRYISDLHLGKVNPELFRKGFDLEADKNDLAAFVRKRVVNASTVKAAFDRIEPPYGAYRRTQEALGRYLALASAMSPLDNAGALPHIKKPVEPGASYADAGQLAAMLRRLGDLPADAPAPPIWTTYDGSLVVAVKHFQERHGLESDGRLGKATIEQLNTPLSYRIRQLQLTLERWRWIPHAFSRPPIVVNIPEFKLRALNGAYQTELEMKVVVGKAYHHQTPVFGANLRSVSFRPYWNVPRSIQREELVPKLDRDRSYLVKNRYQVVTSENTLVNQGEVDDAILAQLRAGKLGIRQVPGPDNALGLVKFLFPNEHNVYLHATPSTQLFSKDRRDFSHGCIRVEKPAELAAWVLRDKPEWTAERIADAMNGATTFQVDLDRTIPVLIVYGTAVVLESGEVRFFKDIYGQDAVLERVLAKGYPLTPWKPTSAVPVPRPRE